MTRLGYQIPNFTYPGRRPGRAVRRRSPRRPRRPTGPGFDTVLRDGPLLPAADARPARRTTCSSATRRSARWPGRRRPVRLGALVTGNTYRNPTLLAKIAHRARHRVGRPGPARHRRRLVRARARLARLRVRHVHRPLREARGGAADHPADAARRAPDARRQALHGAGRDQPAAAGRPHPGHDRRQRREEDAADGGAVRRRVEPHLAVDEIPRKLDVLAAHCERLGRDRSEITVSQALNVVHRRDPRRGLRRHAHASSPTAGSTSTTMDEATRDQILALVVWGDPDEVGERLTDVLEPRRRRHHLLAPGQRPRPRPGRAARPGGYGRPQRLRRPHAIRSSSVPRYASEDPDHVVDVEGSGRDHVLQVGPVAGSG